MHARGILFLLLAGGFGFLLLQSCMQEEEKKQSVNESRAQAGGVHYLSPMECRSCHQAVVDSFLLTGKGRSMQKPEAAAWLCNWLDAKPLYDPKLDLYYQPERQGNQFFIKEFRLEKGDTIHFRKEPISQVVGSGNQTVSFFRNENGYLYEMPLTWYRKKQIWDLSPGYENGNNFGFGRAIGTECVECHSSGFEAYPQSGNRYRKTGLSLTCEACHGEAETHLLRMKENPRAKDPAILQLRKLPAEIQMDVCRQCHLEGVKVNRDKAPSDAFSPGKRFSDYYEVFIPNSGGQEFGFASHAERLQMSRCFQQSEGKMNCSSCHSPHERLPENRSLFFNQKCQNCHGEKAHQKACSAKASNVNCISCHMQRGGTSDIPHVSSTDHWIRRNPRRAKPALASDGLQHFAGKKFSRSELGRAWLYLAETRGDSLSFHRTQEFLPDLPAVSNLTFHYLKNLPGLPSIDTGGFEKSGDALVLFRWAEVKRRAGIPWYSTMKKAISLAPDRIDFLTALAMAEEETGRKPDYQNILKRMPLHPEANNNLAYEALESGNYAKAEMLLKKALKGNPDYALAGENLVRCYVESGNFGEAHKTLLRLIKNNPAENRYRQTLQSLP